MFTQIILVMGLSVIFSFFFVSLWQIYLNTKMKSKTFVIIRNITFGLVLLLIILSISLFVSLRNQWSINFLKSTTYVLIGINILYLILGYIFTYKKVKFFSNDITKTLILGGLFILMLMKSPFINSSNNYTFIYPEDMSAFFAIVSTISFILIPMYSLGVYVLPYKSLNYKTEKKELKEKLEESHRSISTYLYILSLSLFIALFVASDYDFSDYEDQINIDRFYNMLSMFGLVASSLLIPILFNSIKNKNESDDK